MVARDNKRCTPMYAKYKTKHCNSVVTEFIRAAVDQLKQIEYNLASISLVVSDSRTMAGQGSHGSYY